MKKTFFPLVFVSVFSFTFLACSEDEPAVTKDSDICLTGSASTSGQVIKDEYIVTTAAPDPGGRSATVEMILDDQRIPAANVIESFQGAYAYSLLRLSQEEARSLKNDSRVLAVEPDRRISICGCFSVVDPGSVTWSANKVGYGDGAGKTAWIIDTGIDSDHPDLNVDTKRSRSFMQGINSYEDDNGHGTHIGGIIGAKNNNTGILGVASGASLVALKVLDENGDGKLSSLLNALTYIKSNARAGDVVNISVGFPEISGTLESEIKAIASKGIYFALAAGNESTLAGEYSPGRTEGKNIYTVSAVDSLDTYADFSNYGNDVIDFAAPGVRILSTYTDGRYAILSGTSMAAPHVAGILLINNGKVNSVGNAIADPDGIADPIAHR